MTQDESRLTSRGRQWLAVIQDWEGSGLKLREFCARRGVNPATLAWWRRELKRRRERPQSPAGRVQLVEITRSGTSTDQGFEVALANGVRVRLPMQFEPAALKQLLGVLAAC